MIEPANVAETYIVASTVIACTGSNVNVKGNSKAAPVVAPRPGNTPRITPNTVVIKIKNIIIFMYVEIPILPYVLIVLDREIYIF